MNITENSMLSLVQKWDTSIDWKPDELKLMYEYLQKISINNGGFINYDVTLDIKTEEEYFIETINNAFYKVLNNYALSVQSKKNPINYYAVPDNLIESELNFLRSSVYVPKLNLNKATAKELEALPRLGVKLAKDIVGYREKHGHFNKIENILDVKGISSDDLNELKYYLCVEEKVLLYFISPTIETFKDNPDMSNYIALIKECGGIFGGREELIDKSINQIILNEIRKIAEFIKENYYKKLHPYRRIKASEILKRKEQQVRAEEIEKNAEKNIKGATVLDDSGYYYFVQKALSQSQKRIWITMFFMAFRDEEKHPTDKLMDILIEAKNRGVDVKVILDKDMEDEPYLSRIINKEAYDKFKEAAIDVVFDDEEKITHSKSIIIDDKHIIIGSHNWTAGSYFIYDDKSIYFESEGLVEKASLNFTNLWSKYSK